MLLLLVTCARTALVCLRSLSACQVGKYIKQSCLKFQMFQMQFKFKCLSCYILYSWEQMKIIISVCQKNESVGKILLSVNV